MFLCVSLREFCIWFLLVDAVSSFVEARCTHTHTSKETCSQMDAMCNTSCVNAVGAMA